MRTKAHRGFLPSRLDGLELEVRVVLSQGTLTAPALVLNPARHSARALRHLSPQDNVNQAFDRFTTDYLQAQQVFLASTGLPASGVNSAESAFKDFTTLRVNLLSQELVQALGRLPGATTKLRPNQRLTQSMSTTLQSFLYRKIDGKIQPSARSDTSNSDPSYGNISLLTTLNAAVPPAPTDGSAISPAAATLFTLKASNAIESARINTINAAYLMSSGTFWHHK